MWLVLATKRGGKRDKISNSKEEEDDGELFPTPGKKKRKKEEDAHASKQAWQAGRKAGRQAGRQAGSNQMMTAKKKEKKRRLKNGDTGREREREKLVTYQRFYVWRTKKKKSTDDPWINSPTKKRIKQRNEVYESEGRSSTSFKTLSAKVREMIKNRKKSYYDRECQKIGAEGSHKTQNGNRSGLCEICARQ